MDPSFQLVERLDEEACLEEGALSVTPTATNPKLTKVVKVIVLACACLGCVAIVAKLSLARTQNSKDAFQSKDVTSLYTPTGNYQAIGTGICTDLSGQCYTADRKNMHVGYDPAHLNNICAQKCSEVPQCIGIQTSTLWWQGDDAFYCDLLYPAGQAPATRPKEPTGPFQLAHQSCTATGPIAKAFKAPSKPNLSPIDQARDPGNQVKCYKKPFSR
mmetsp:Transcript_101949/g.161135  ORF Transcript_101949/g.161135 Transcript_101949/m.161135 type:complete len:216 (+) Transcript_101949:58-705(+)